MNRISRSISVLLVGAALAELLLVHACGKLGEPASGAGGSKLPAAVVPEVGLAASPTTVVVSAVAPGATALTAQLVDPTTQLPARGVPVTFSATTGQLSANTAVSDPNGVASVVLNVPAGTPGSTGDVTARAHGASSSVSLPIADLAAITLSASPSFASCSAAGPGLSVINALALDSSNRAIPGVTISFNSDGGSVSPLSTTDSDGTAPTSLSVPPGLPTGMVRVTAQAAGVGSSINVPVVGCAAAASATPTPAPGGVPAVIQFVSAVPSQVGVLGSGLPQQSLLTFKLTDSLANPVSGVTVNFFIPSIGGEFVSPKSAVTDSSGNVQTALTSGRRATIVEVTASTGSVLANSTPVTIVGGLPVQGRISAAVQFRNIAGNVTAGLIDPVSILMSDRFSNPVQPGTAVSLQSLGGAVSAPAPSDSNGIATGALIAEAPTSPTDLNGVSTRGIITVLALTRGETPFIDSNGNGVYDSGETVIPVPEPFYDLNGNGVRDANEPFVDLNGNGKYDTSQSGGAFSQSVVVFTSTRVTFSGPTVATISPPSGFLIPNAGSQSFTLTLADGFGNPLVAGSTYQIVSQPAGTVVSASGTVPDGQSFGALVSGLNLFNFTINDSDPGAISPVPIMVTVTVTSPSTLTAPGGNGSTTAQVSGTMN